MIHRILLAFLAVTALMASSCDLIEDAVPDIAFNVEGSEINFTLPAQDEAGTFSVVAADIPSDVKAELDAEDIDDERVKSIGLISIELLISDANAAVDFGVIDDVTATLSAPGFADLELADLTGERLSGDRVQLDVDQVDLTDRLLAESATYTVTITTNDSIPAPVELTARPTFAVVASPL
ncbi:hypothetical protein [Lewinella sp. 4G2]|uniref:hypothetical protein n=1 Tax=Lewinella sp. 4G2 TaxID=1803372 RepID=UPI0007B46561|nr:hypothetical protein [Lewinella sp. 4G2]OAV45708.1 hypothetical protein A3850_014940 [Lewinella sp. 4G2]